MTFPTSITAPDSEHRIADEQTDAVVNPLINFFSGYSTMSGG
jgi:hypothetical protein